MKPERMLGLVALRKAWPSRDDDDRPAALGMSVDCDGMIRPGPLTVEDVITYASFQLMGPDELERMWMPEKVLNEAIPPAYTEWIGRQLLAAIGEAVA